MSEIARSIAAAGGSVFINPHHEPVLVSKPPAFDAVRDFHRWWPGYLSTPLLSMRDLGQRLGIPELWVKDESRRLGLPAFKMLGASWGAYVALRDRLGDRLQPWTELSDLRRQVSALGPLTLATATDGNHGRAVARVAAMLGLRASVYVPRDVGDVRIEAIRSEGAGVTVVDGTYDDALARCLDELDEGTVLASDTAVGGHEGFARTVIDGYGTLLSEAAEQFAGAGGSPPDLVFVQMGVGSLAASIIIHAPVLAGSGGTAPGIIGVEPDDANCVMASLRAGHKVQVPGPHRSRMVGLNCGWPSDVAWPLLRAGLRATISVDDTWADKATKELAGCGVRSGASGAAGLAGLMYVIAAGVSLDELGGRSVQSVLVINTEGDTARAG
jgi:diaminopropionate ammonia-lyase